MFQNARNTVINGGTFMGNDRGRLMERLERYMASGAFHNSDERYDPPKCHPRTRKAVLGKIMDWVKDGNKVALFLWLYGPAGAGKSAIAQTIAELLEEAGLLAAAFFFSRNAAGRNDKTPLVATLVYQLIKSIPEIRAHVLEALEQDPALFSCSIQAQIQALIIKPLNAVANDETLAPTLLSRPRLIIVDGLDECRTAEAQTHILNALSTAVKNLQIPLFFFIASRPEHDIRQSFNDQDGLGSLSFSIALDDTYQPDDDIRVFLQSTFDEIKRKHPSKAHFPASWPSSEDILRLVRKSSGQFIFASTVAKYVNSHRHWPPDRLKIIFGQSEPGQETPFTELDSLYHLILSSVADTEKLQDFLAFLVLHPFSRLVPRPRQTTRLIEKYLFYRPGEIDIILTDLHSIIYVPPPGDGYGELRFFHASLLDFLLDRSRSKDLFLDQGAGYAKLTGLFVKHIKNVPRNNQDRILVHRGFRWCCVNARPSPKLLEDLCGLNLAGHLRYQPMQFGVTTPELMCWFGRQRLSPDGTETLLDHHSAIFDGWLRSGLLTRFHPYLAVVTLLDQLDPEEYNWQRVSVILKQDQLVDIPDRLLDLFGGTKANIQLSRIMSKFVMDRARAGLLWVNSQTYADLTRDILDILRDKRFIDIVHIHTRIPMIWLETGTTYYEVGKLAFNLLSILLSRIKALGGPQVHKVRDLLRSYPAFHLIKDDRLELEKVKAAKAVQEFLKE